LKESKDRACKIVLRPLFTYSAEIRANTLQRHSGTQQSCYFDCWHWSSLDIW